MSWKATISTDRYKVPSKGFVQAVKVSDLGTMLFVSGVTARREDGSVDSPNDAGGQTRQILRNLDALLREAGGGLVNLVHTVTYLTDMKDLDSVQQVKVEVLGNVACASTTVAVSQLVDPDQLVEIEAIAIM